MRMHHQGKLKLFPSCRLVTGASFSAVYDLERRKLFRFSNSWLPLIEWVSEKDGLALEELDSLDSQGREKCKVALSYLADNELAYRADLLSAGELAELPLNWHSPYRILNALIDVKDVEHNWIEVLEQLQKLGCRSLQIRAFSGSFDIDRAAYVLQSLSGSGITHIYLVVQWSQQWAYLDWRDFFERFKNLVDVKVHSAPAAAEVSGKELSRLQARRITFTTETLSDQNCCGHIEQASLSLPNANLFSELQTFNGCLNRKVSIRADGEICNCPSMRTTYGKDLQAMGQVISSVAFQKSWRINKDQVSDCKVCEYRYVCTDCRAYLGSDYSMRKPARCRYDPHSGVWNARSSDLAIGSA